MQRAVHGYRGRSHLTRSHHVHENDDHSNRLSISNSSSKDTEDVNNKNNSTITSKDSSISASMSNGADFELAIRSLRSLSTSEKKSKMNSNTSDQSYHWFPKPDIGHVHSNDFIRHNHVDSQSTIDQPTAPTLLTTIPPVGISTRPTAIIVPAVPTRSMSAFFSSNSFIKQTNSKSIYDFQSSTILKSTPQPGASSFIQTASSAFQPIDSTHSLSLNVNNRSTKISSQPPLKDISKHKSLKRGQKLSHVHISHPESPSIIHLMLPDDFNVACRLLHQMAAHPELHSTYSPPCPFQPEINQICACFHEARWFRCRILHISPDRSSARVIYLDWGMTMPVPIKLTCIRHLPAEFFTEPACSIICHLDGVPDADDSISSDVIVQCIKLLNEKEYEVVVNDYHDKTGGKIILFNNERIVNDLIKQLLLPNNCVSAQEELAEQFCHELQLSVGDESKALLSSFSGKDDTFYVLIINDDTVALDRAMSELQEDHIPSREFLQIPQPKTLVVARYVDDRKYYRAWVKSVDIQHEQALVFFVDFGNESKVIFSDIYICPESVRTLPWLGVRVRLSGEKMSAEELTAFWNLTESHYLWIRVHEIFKDSYGIQVKIDYTVYLRHERLKMFTPKQSINKSVQTKFDERLTYPRNSSEKNLSVFSLSLNDQVQPSNENFLCNLFEMINNELRSLRHRINDSDEASQDRHGQLMQLLFSIFDFNNTNNPTKDSQYT